MEAGSGGLGESGEFAGEHFPLFIVDAVEDALMFVGIVVERGDDDGGEVVPGGTGVFGSAVEGDGGESGAGRGGLAVGAGEDGLVDVDGIDGIGTGVGADVRQGSDDAGACGDDDGGEGGAALGDGPVPLEIAPGDGDGDDEQGDRCPVHGDREGDGCESGEREEGWGGGTVSEEGAPVDVDHAGVGGEGAGGVLGEGVGPRGGEGGLGDVEIGLFDADEAFDVCGDEAELAEGTVVEVGDFVGGFVGGLEMAGQIVWIGDVDGESMVEGGAASFGGEGIGDVGQGTSYVGEGVADVGEVGVDLVGDAILVPGDANGLDQMHEAERGALEDAVVIGEGAGGGGDGKHGVEALFEDVEGVGMFGVFGATIVVQELAHGVESGVDDGIAAAKDFVDLVGALTRLAHHVVGLLDIAGGG